MNKALEWCYSSDITKNRLYWILHSMKSRCYNPNVYAYKWYGGKGITICPEWLSKNGVENFIEWALNNGYREGLTIDRINPDKPYSPNNCQWITRSENSKRAKHERKAFVKSNESGLHFKIDVLQALKDKGYNTNTLRKNKLLAEGALQRLRHSEPVSWSSLAQICKMLECQPGDLIEYVPDTAD